MRKNPSGRSIIIIVFGMCTTYQNTKWAVIVSTSGIGKIQLSKHKLRTLLFPWPLGFSIRNRGSKFWLFASGKQFWMNNITKHFDFKLSKYWHCVDESFPRSGSRLQISTIICKVLSCQCNSSINKWNTIWWNSLVLQQNWQEFNIKPRVTWLSQKIKMNPRHIWIIALGKMFCNFILARCNLGLVYKPAQLFIWSILYSRRCVSILAAVSKIA